LYQEPGKRVFIEPL